MPRPLFTLVLLATLLGSPAALAQDLSLDACARLTGGAGDGLKSIQCIATLAKALAALKPVETVPAGLVVASLAECRTLPGGWSDFQEGRGRMIVGAGAHDSNPFGAGLTMRPAFSVGMVSPDSATVGGAEAVALTVDQIPAHMHNLITDSADGETNGQRLSVENQIARAFFPGHDPWYILHGRNTPATLGRSSSVGGGEPHDNMPPFIALHLCKKN